uniref:G-protein coupled receptors family 1 profile domain-containing protein n=1 Tax=Parascaris univalens TaxID=6257 RepID=A0A915B4C2_PARUN
MNISEEEQCFYAQPEFLVERFWLVTVSGTTIASISIIENLFLFLVLVTKRHHRNSHSLYLLLLAFFDVSVSGAYIPLMSLSHLVDYMHSVILLRAWFFYMIPMITISHIAMTSSSFLILSASFERYCVIAMPHRMECLNRYRCQIATAAIILGIVTKSTLAFEFSIKYQNECFDTMAEYALELSALAKDPIYNLLWRLWFRNGITILLPFFLLAFMNARTAISLHRSELIPEDMQKLSESQRKSRVRAATRALVFVVFTYLVSNILNVIITIWEFHC